MDDEIGTVFSAIETKIRDLLALAAELGDADLNRAPEVAGANSPFVIVTHVLGNVRAWVLGIVCEQPLDRDRPAEFRSQGRMDELTKAGETLIVECAAALEALAGDRLADRIVPRQVLFGEGKTYAMTRRAALLHPLEHASLHAGQLQLTADLLKQG